MIKEITYSMPNIFQLQKIEDVCFGKDAWTIGNLRGEFENTYSRFFGYYDGDKILGYACVRIMYEEAQVCNIAVLPDYRKQGIGTLLVNALVDYATDRKCEVVELEVNTLNEPAVNLYKKCGFEIAGTRVNFYRKSRYASKDAYTMLKKCNE